MWRNVTIVGTLFVCGLAVSLFIPKEFSYTVAPPAAIQSTLQTEAFPYFTTSATTIETAPTLITVSSDSLSGYTQTEMDQRMAGLLFHVRWLMAQNKPAIRRSGGGGGGSSNSTLRRQLNALQIQVDALAAATSSSVSSSGLATTSLDTSAELLAILTDETGTGNSVFSVSPTLTGTLTAAAANFSGNVGIGTTTPSQKLTVEGAGLITGHVAIGDLASPDNSYALLVYEYATSSMFGQRTIVDGYLPAGNSVYGGSFEAYDSGTSNNTYVTGVYGGGYALGSGTGISIKSFDSGSVVSGTVGADVYGLYNALASFDSATVNNNYGVYLARAYGNNVGGILNNYGLYVVDQSGIGSNQSFNIYSAGANSKNYFAGNVGIGTSTPNAKLSIDASASNLTPLSIKTNGSAGNYTAENSGIFVYDDAGTELLRIWAGDPNVVNFNSGNLYIGSKAGLNQPTNNVSAGYYNTGVGFEALYSNTTGLNNSALGYKAMRANTTGLNNTAQGRESLTTNTTGYGNSAFGGYSLSSNVDGFANTAVGYSALYSNASGDSNTVVGNYALYSNTIGNENTAVGTGALSSNTSGDFNTVAGMYALYYQTSGNRNTGLGNASGYNPSNDIAQYRIIDDTDMVLLGYGATKNNAATLTNGIAIGSGAHVLQSNQVVLGNDSITSTLLKGNVGIGTTSPGSKFAVIGTTNPSQGNALEGWGGTLYSQEYHSLTLTSPDGTGSKRYGNDFARLEVDATGSNTVFLNKASNLLATGSGVADSNIFIDIDSTADYVAPNSSNATLIAIEGYANNKSGFTIGSVYGGQFGAYNSAANSVSANLVASLGSAGNGCTNCTSTNATGVWGDIYNAGSGVDMANAYGLRSTFYNTGTVTNTYGLYIDDVTSGTQTNQAYGLYQADTAARNYFAGNVGIGTSTPNAKLAINGQVAPTGPELISNGSFTGSAAGWTLGNCAVYGSNKVTVTYTSCAQPNISTTLPTVSGNTYYINFTVSNLSNNEGVYIYFNQNANSFEDGPFRNGTHTIAFTTTYTGSETINFTSWTYSTNGAWTIDDVSVKQAPAVSSILALNNYGGTSVLNIGGTLANISIGNNAGQNSLSSQNIFIGNSSGAVNTTGYRNTFFGQNTGGSNTSGYYNTFVGNDAGFSNTTGVGNTFLGRSTGLSNTSGFTNLFVGGVAGSSNTTGAFNTLIGPYAGYSQTTASLNTMLGYAAGGNITTGSGNIFLGNQIDSTSPTASNQLNIGNLLFGNGLDGTGTTLSSGNIGIGTSTPNQRLTIFKNAADAAIELSSASGSAYKWSFGIDYSDGAKFKISSSSALGTNDRFVIDGNGNIGIGLTPSNRGRLQVATTRTETAGFFTGSEITIAANPSGNSTAINNGLSIYAESQAGNIRNMAGINGILSGAFHNGSGVLTNLDAVYAYTDNYGQVTNVTGVSAEGYNSGVITNQKFFEVTDLANFGTVTNTYGVYVGDITSGTQTNTPYSFYASDTNAKNYFAGSTGLGTSSPIARFTVTGPTVPTGGSSQLLTWGPLYSQEMHYANYSGLIGSNYTNEFSNSYTKLDVNATGATTGIFNGAFQLNVTGVGGSDASVLDNIEAGAFYSAPNSSNSSVTSVSGYSYNRSGYGISTLYGGAFTAGNVSANSTTTTAYGVSAAISNGVVNGKINEAISLNSYIDNANASAAVTNWYGLRAYVGSNTGTLTNTYGVFVGDITAGTQTNTPYSLYASDSNARNYFAGNVGIGTSTPVQKLQVFGDIRVGTAGSNGCLEDYGGGVISGTCSSDERLKENIEPIAQEGRSYLEALAALTPVTYNWNERAAELYSKNANIKNLGLTAQDVEKQFPELVSVNGDGYRQVDFRALPFYILEALKELWLKVQGHDERLESLEKENEYLRDRISNIENELNIEAPPEPIVEPSQAEPQPDPPPSENPEPDVPSEEPDVLPDSPSPDIQEPLPVPEVSEDTEEPTYVLVPGVSE